MCRLRRSDAMLHYPTSSSSVALHTSTRHKNEALRSAYASLTPKKRRSRGRWQRSRDQGDRIIYNRLKTKLQTALRNANNATFEHNLTSLSPSDNTLWKATKRLKRPQTSIPPIRKADGSWAKSDDEKAMAFADHLQKVFTPTTSQILPTLKSLPS